MLFDEIEASGLLDNGTAAAAAAAAALVFLPTNVVNDMKDDCTEAVAETEAVDGCCDGCLKRKYQCQICKVSLCKKQKDLFHAR